MLDSIYLMSMMTLILRINRNFCSTKSQDFGRNYVNLLNL